MGAALGFRNGETQRGFGILEGFVTCIDALICRMWIASERHCSVSARAALASTSGRRLRPSAFRTCLAVCRATIGACPCRPRPDHLYGRDSSSPCSSRRYSPRGPSRRSQSRRRYRCRAHLGFDRRRNRGGDYRERLRHIGDPAGHRRDRWRAPSPRHSPWWTTRPSTSPPRLTAAGTVDIVVTTDAPNANTTADDFTYVVPAPVVSSVAPVSGPAVGGTLVTITGTDFTGATQVSFDGTFVAATSVSGDVAYRRRRQRTPPAKSMSRW